MFRRFMLCALAAAMAIVVAPMGSRAADPKLQELQRDVASLQEQVRLLKESQDKQLAALTVLVQQALDTSNRFAHTFRKRSRRASGTGKASRVNSRRFIKIVNGCGASMDRKSTRLNSSHLGIS